MHQVAQLASLVVLAIAFVSDGRAAGPVAGRASWAGYSNETSITVIVRSSYMVNGRVQHNPPLQINPRESAWDQIASPGVRSITIYDAKTSQAIHQTQYNFTGQDVYFSLQADPQTGMIRLVPAARPGN